jgi:hypothetical protein
MTFRTMYGHVSVVSATNVSVCEQESEFAWLKVFMELDNRTL